MTSASTGHPDRIESYDVTALQNELGRLGVRTERNPLHLHALSHDASHYACTPVLTVTPSNAADVAKLFRVAAKHGAPITFRSGGTSLSGQGVSDQLLVDTRSAFRRTKVGDAGLTVDCEPGVTVRRINSRLAHYHRKLGPDPASEIACTIGGVIANNSSGMECGITDNSYHTVRSLRLVLASGTVLDTADSDADEQLQRAEPALYAGLLALRQRLLASPDDVAIVQRLFSMKNTMGYGVNALLDFDHPIDILTHLVIGSEGTLAFIAEARFATVKILAKTATALLIFDDLAAATAALPQLVASGLATIELMDAQSLRVAQQDPAAPDELRSLSVANHAAFLVEVHAHTASELADQEEPVQDLFEHLTLSFPTSLSEDPARTAALWHIRRGLYAAVAGARPQGTTALLEDIVVPVEALLATCQSLLALFKRHGYENSVIFGHAKDGNIHFMITEHFGQPSGSERYRAFTEDMVELVLRNGGSLKAEHGTGRVMAPFVRRQYGEALFQIMKDIKHLFDPHGILNPGVVLSDDPASYLANMKTAPSIETEVDRCVECGYCEPFCPSKDLTLTPRQRIVIRREIVAAEHAGDADLAQQLRKAYDYAGIQSCAVDGMCQTACPVGINTGDLVRRLRTEQASTPLSIAWKLAARRWGAVTRTASLALTIASHTPPTLTTAFTRVARVVMGSDTVPLYDAGLPSGGQRRFPIREADPVAVFFPTCVGSMFGPTRDQEGIQKGIGASSAFIALAERAGLALSAPEEIESMCCGTPWKSKGYHDGHRVMAERVLPALLAASNDGSLPIVCDAASCTEGLQTMRDTANLDPSFNDLRFIDATQFVHDHILDRLTVTSPLPSIAVHHTCSTTILQANETIDHIAAAITDQVIVPDNWGCCAFAGDRGLLHPELTASAAREEADEIALAHAADHVSANRTCEIGMTRATGRSYRHILEALEEATRMR